MNFKDLIPFGKKNLAVRRDEENPVIMMQHEMNRILDSFASAWGPAPFPLAGASFSPRLDMAEDAKTFTVTAELPGMSDKDIDLSISGDALVIRGDKKEEKEEKGRNYYYSERSYGSFSRSIPLPPEVAADKVSATFRKGVLTITLPKTADVADGMKKIPVRTD